MAEKCRSLNFFLLVCALLSGLLFYGCGGGGTGSDPIPVKVLQITGNVNSAVPLANMLASQEAGSESLRASFTTSNIEVYLESNRAQFSTRTDAAGNYILSGVPAGTHIVIAMFKAADNKLYKVRSKEIIVTEREKISQAPVMVLQEATKSVSGIIVDSQGNPQRNAPLTIWGETFTTDSNGMFTTPLMPRSASPYTIYVNVPGFQASTMNVEFDNAPFIEQTVVSTTATNRPPTAYIKATNNPTNTTSPNGRVSFAAITSDPDKDILSYNWSATAGTLSTSADQLKRTWTAPTADTLATITFSATDPGGLTATAAIMITVGTGVTPNKAPTIKGGITSTSDVFLGNTDYLLSVNATDSDRDVLFYTWSTAAGVFVSPNNQSTVTWRTPDVSVITPVEVTVKVEDNKGGMVSATATFRVGDPVPNQAPVVTISYPQPGALILSNTTFSYTGSAIDPDDDAGPTEIAANRLTWYQSKDGSTVQLAGTGKTVPRNLLPGTYSVTLEASDKLNKIGSATVEFRINAAPEVEITGPANGVRVAIGTPITFTAVGTDIEDGPLSDGSFFWKFPVALANPNNRQQIVDNLATGTHRIEVSSRDSMGVYSATAAVNVTIFNNGPLMTIATPALYVMQGQPFTVSGSGTDTTRLPYETLSASRMKWELYRTATETISSGFSNFTHPGLSTLGQYTLTLTGSDTTGVSSSTSILFTVNATPTVTITSPASGTRFDIGENIEFRASVGDDSDGLTIRWYGDGTLLNGTSNNLPGVNDYATSTLAFGNRVIRCEVIDRYGIASSGTINVLVNTLPVATITYDTSFHPQYATGPADIPVFISANSETTLRLTADTRAYDTVAGAEASPTSILWFTPQSEIPFATGKTITQNFPLGLATVTVRVYDSLRNTFEHLASSTTHFNFYVWQGRTLTGAASSTFIHGDDPHFYITASGPSALSTVKKYKLIDGLSPVADLVDDHELLATFTAALAAVIYDNDIAVLGSSPAPGVIYRLDNPQLIELKDRQVPPQNATQTISWAAHATDPTFGYFTTSYNELFTFNPIISSSENRITSVDGDFVELKNVRYVYGSNAAGKVFVADKGNDRVVRFLNDSCSNPRTFPAPSPTDIAFTRSYIMTLSETTREITVHEITSSENRVLMKIPLSPLITTPKSIYCSGKDLFIIDGTSLHLIRSGLNDWLK